MSRTTGRVDFRPSASNTPSAETQHDRNDGHIEVDQEPSPEFQIRLEKRQGDKGDGRADDDQVVNHPRNLIQGISMTERIEYSANNECHDDSGHQETGRLEPLPASPA